jgi:uncharacterized membrane protein YsdA (DUF1294 family)
MQTTGDNPMRDPNYRMLYFGPAIIIVLSAVLIFVATLDPLVAVLVAANGVTFALFAYDKAIAGSGARRIPNVALWVPAIFTGWGGALAGIYLLRHKTSQKYRSLRLIIWAIAVLQIAIWVALLTLD